MKLHIAVFNKTQVITAFLPQAIKIAELFGCVVQIKCDGPLAALPAGLDFLPVQPGNVTELEICVQGDDAGKALSAMRLCMSQCYNAVDYQVN
jgi:hypothetical protein